jgi:hypothetical protein
LVFAINKKLPPVIQFFAAAIIYTAFAAWLFWPHLNKITGIQTILPITTVVSAAGVFLLARRYVNSFVASFFAGIIYGFGPFASAFYCGYHPFAALIYAALPWTFIPAVFLHKLTKADDKTTNLLAAVLSLLPFVFVIVCFTLAAMPKYRLIPIPIGTAVSIKSLIGLISPADIKFDDFSIGFYHVPLAALAVGLILFFKTRRFWIAVLFLSAVFLSLYKPLLDVPSVFWLSFVVLICSLIIAEGFEAIVLAGKADANWLLLSALILLLQLSLSFALGQSQAFPLSAAISAIAVIAVLFIFFISRTGFAMHYLRMAALYSVALLDVVIVTRTIIDKIFG